MKIELHTKDNFITITKISYFKHEKYNTMVYYDNYGDKTKNILFEGVLSIDEIIIRLEDLFRKEVE